jgi:hypothetical protein
MAGAYAGQARRPGPCCKLESVRPLAKSGPSCKTTAAFEPFEGLATIEASTASMVLASSATEPAVQHLTQQAATDFLIGQRAT